MLTNVKRYGKSTYDVLDIYDIQALYVQIEFDFIQVINGCEVVTHKILVPIIRDLYRTRTLLRCCLEEFFKELYLANYPVIKGRCDYTIQVLPNTMTPMHEKRFEAFLNTNSDLVIEANKHIAFEEYDVDNIYKNWVSKFFYIIDLIHSVFLFTKNTSIAMILNPDNKQRLRSSYSNFAQSR